MFVQDVKENLFPQTIEDFGLAEILLLAGEKRKEVFASRS